MIRNFMVSSCRMTSTAPASFRKLVVRNLSPIFKDAVEVVARDLVQPHSKEVLVKNKYVGINASDINIAAGRYLSNKLKVPFDIGFEGVGEVVDMGDAVSELKYGQSVMYIKLGAFSEYMYISEDEVIPISSTSPEMLPILISGAAASLSLDKCGHIVPGEKVLITSAAGGTGHIAVQWAKNAGCHVIGTCSTPEKIQFLESIGCHRPINYTQESVESVLLKEYPNGIDVIWETTGEKNITMLLQHLAPKGRLVIIGAISQYLKDSITCDSNETMLIKLLLHSTSISGFLLHHYWSDIPHYLSLLVRQFHDQCLKLQIDDGSSQGKAFNGLEDISRALEHMYSKRNKGKVIVTL